MASTAAFQERNRRRHLIRNLDKQVFGTKAVQFRPNELHKLGIRVISASFASTSGNTGLDPSFFEPYPHRLLTLPRDGMVDHDFPEYNPESRETPVERARSLDLYFSDYLPECGAQRPEVEYNVFHDSGWCYRDVQDYKFKTLWEFDPQMSGGWIPEWYVQSIYHHRDQKIAHIKSTMISDVDGDDETLFRGELLALIRIIRGRLATKAAANHAIHPILMFSIMGIQHARILQAHFNGTELVIQRSKLYDFRHEDVKLLEFFAQWFLSSPVGDTGLG